MNSPTEQVGKQTASRLIHTMNRNFLLKLKKCHPYSCEAKMGYYRRSIIGAVKRWGYLEWGHSLLQTFRAELGSSLNTLEHFTNDDERFSNLYFFHQKKMGKYFKKKEIFFSNKICLYLILYLIYLIILNKWKNENKWKNLYIYQIFILSY